MMRIDLVARMAFCYFALLSSPGLFAQANFMVHYRLDEGKLQLRLAPVDTRTFPRPIDRSYYVDLLSISEAGAPALIYQDELKPLPYDDWMRAAEVLPDTSSLLAVYFDSPQASELKRIFEEDLEGQLTPNLYDLARLNLLELANRNSFPAAQRSGYAFAFDVPPNTEAIGGKVHTPGMQDTFYFDIPVANYQPAAVPDLRVVWKSRNAYLSWRTTEYRDDYWGWWVEKSVNGGPFVPQFDLPLENSFDTIVGAPDTANYLTHRDPRIDNDDAITYRLYGIDYLGKKSQIFQEVTGGGISDIQNSPLLIEAVQTDSNYAVLRWEMKEDDAPLVTEYVVVQRDTLGGPYEVALRGIDPGLRQIALPMKYRSNYYRVQAVSAIGTTLSSFEGLVMSYDLDPPAVPRDFTGYIDTLGLVYLSWTTSNEPDLDGYYLFKGFEEKEEKAMITPIPLKGPTHVDTVSMVNPTETIYYQLRSVDTRGNSSNFTPILALAKPDVYPPVQPQFTKVGADERAIRLQWVKSPSDDVVGYRLFRRVVGADDFELIHESTPADPRVYRDTLVQQRTDYEYIIRAVDDAGLVSEASQPAALGLRSFDVRPPIQNFTLTSNAEERTITVNWTYDQSPREFYLYRGKEDEPVSLLKVLAGDERTFLDERLKKGITYKYLIRAIFPDGKVSPFTNEQNLLLE